MRDDAKYVTIPGCEGKIYMPSLRNCKKKHDCKDCYDCQMCSDDRCEKCLGEKKKPI
jgi:hypothetical protein